MRHFLPLYFRVLASAWAASGYFPKQDSALSVPLLLLPLLPLPPLGLGLFPAQRAAAVQPPFEPASEKQHFLAKCFRVAADFEVLVSVRTAAWSGRAQPGPAPAPAPAAAAAPCCFPRPGDLGGSAEVSVGGRGQKQSLGLPPVDWAPDLAGLGVQGAGSPRGWPGLVAGSPFWRPGGPACPLDAYSPKACLAYT